MGTFGAMSKSFGFSEEAAYEMSKTVTGLVGDVASFYNISQDLAAIKLKAIWSGETEGLKDLGIVMTQTALEEYALQKGMGKTISNMSEAEKVALRYSFVQDKLALATGDFARTSDGWANQTRVLSLRFEQLKATLGQGFITLFTPIIKGINTVLAGLQKVADVFTAVVNKIFGKQKETVSSVSTGYSSLGSSALKSADDITSASKKTQKAIMGYDKLNILNNNKNSDKKSNSSSIPNIGSANILPSDEVDTTNSNVDKIASHIAGVLDKIKISIKNAWNSQPIQAFVGAATTYGQFLFDYWSTLGLNLWQNLQTTWSNIEGNVRTLITNMSILWTTFWTDLQVGIETWGQPIIDGVTGIFNSIWLKGINPAIQLMTKAWSDFSGILVSLWNEHGQVLINNIGECVTNIISLFQSIWDNILEPIITPFLETLSWLWEEHLSKVVQKVGDLVGKLANGALEIFNKFIQPILMWLLEKLAPAWSMLCGTIIGLLGSVAAVISDVFGSIVGILGGIIDFIAGVFTGNWRKAWQGVRDIFKNIVDSLVGIIKFPINSIIDIINGFIKGLNKVKVPDWVPAVGGKGINIPTIPKLAEGAWFKARNPRLAIIGEGKDNEIVAPEPKLDDAIDKGLKKHGGSGKSTIDININVKYEDGRSIRKKLKNVNIEDGKVDLDI